MVADPRELTIVSVNGPIRPEDVADLPGHFGIPRLDLAGAAMHVSGSRKEKEKDKGKDKDKDKDKGDREEDIPVRFAGMALAWALCSLRIRRAPQIREFKDVVREISDEFHTKPMHIPMMGLVNGFMKVAHPVGAKHVELAIFQDIDWGEGSERSPVASVKHALGEWTPFVTITQSITAKP